MPSPLPQQVSRLAAGDEFRFGCHPGVACFTDCCRELELALTPYDVLRLKKALQLNSAEFLRQYVLLEQEDGDPFPHCYLAMVDDGRASCPFVSAAGCRVYQDRPGACRAYPVGRAASLSGCGGRREWHVLIREPHCHGFEAETLFSSATWTADQGLEPYNRYNDEWMALLQHPRIRQGALLGREQRELFLLALFNLDEFRLLLASREVTPGSGTADDPGLLSFAVGWLIGEFFGKDETH